MTCNTVAVRAMRVRLEINFTSCYALYSLLARFDPTLNTLPYLITVLLHGHHMSIAMNANLSKLKVLGLCAAALLEIIYCAVVVWRMKTSFARDGKNRQRRRIGKLPRLWACRL
jgi:hypothetical protein